MRKQAVQYVNKPQYTYVTIYTIEKDRKNCF